MAASAALTFSGTVTGLPNGSMDIGPLTFSNSNANGQVQVIALASGANTITVPTGPAPRAVLVVLPSDNTQAVTIKGLTGDTGIVLDKIKWFFLPFESSPPASFVINSAAAQTSKYTYIYFF